MIRKIKFRNKTGNNLVGILYTPKKIRNTIILSHGYLANKDGPGGLFIDLAKRLYGLNYQVLTFDYSFCGESEGCARDLRRSCLISDLSSAINYLNKKEIILVGYSAGALTSLMNYNKVNTTKIVFISPPTRFKLWTLKKAEHYFGSGKTINLYDKILIGIDYILNLFKFNLINEFNKITIPCLFFYADKDELCDYDNLNKINNKNIKLIKVKNSGHLLKGKKRFIIAKIVKWIENGK